MLPIPAGSFQMGSRAGDADEKPLHTVVLSSFYLSKTETTCAQFQTFIDSSDYLTDAERGDGSFIWDSLGWHKQDGINWRHDERGRLRSQTPGAFGTYPVLHVSWNDAVRYCNWLSQQAGLTQVYNFQADTVITNFSANGYRLPTEAEWEYTAGEGKATSMPPFSGSGSLYTLAWYSGNSGSRTHPTALKKANTLGCYDLTGNVWEWCQDWYDPRFTQKALWQPTRLDRKEHCAAVPGTTTGRTAASPIVAAVFLTFGMEAWVFGWHGSEDSITAERSQ